MNCFVCFCIVRSCEKKDFLENSHPVFLCLIEKHSYELFVCFGIKLKLKIITLSEACAPEAPLKGNPFQWPVLYDEKMCSISVCG